MEIASGFWAQAFIGAESWAARLTDSTITVRGIESVPAEFDLAAIRGVKHIAGSLWSTIEIDTQVSTIRLRGAPRSKAAAFERGATQAIVRAVHAAISAAGIDAVEALGLDALYREHRFLSNRDIELWLQAALQGGVPGFIRYTDPQRKRVLDLIKHPLLADERHRADLPLAARQLHDLVAGTRSGLKARNGTYIAAELERQQQLFDTIESRPLTEEQRRAAIVLEDRNLVVAAAGSGKSSTVVAKIGHALASGFCGPKEILALAFNSSAADELADRVGSRLSVRFPEANAVSAKTFHKLGLDIIAQVESKKPDLAPWASETRDNEGAIIEQLVAELSAGDPRFLLKWILLRALCAYPNEDDPRFASLDQYELEQERERDGADDLRTLNGELVKSREELVIANWLFISGVTYEYERPYEHDTADQDHRQYHPDFYYPDINCYHEHFALDARGNANPRFANYMDGVRWKRELHDTHQTDLFETTSAMHHEDCLLDKLEDELKSRGQAFAPRSLAEVEERLGELKIPSFANFVRSFITHAKSNGLGPEDLRSKVSVQRDRFRARLFLDVVSPLIEAYERKLRSINCIDFEDMILIAARAVEAGRFKHPYRLILVDEFQDISRCRARLVQAMLKQNPDCRLFAVGDDWQSIYRFAGADQSIMLDFEKEFGITHTSYLTKTFRSNQGIANTASAFVQKNPKQMRKKISAANPRAASTVHILEYDRDEDVGRVLEGELLSLAQHARSRAAKIEVLVLGRYNHARPSDLPKWQRALADAVDLRFLTLHRAKGLEADYVFIVGVNSGRYGFPSDIADDPLLELVLPTPESFEAAEERRLFYVGITRAKHRCHILTKRGKSSVFVPELLTSDDTVVYRMGSPQSVRVCAEACPKCEGGVLREKTGAHGSFLGCSNYPRCTHSKRMSS